MTCPSNPPCLICRLEAEDPIASKKARWGIMRTEEEQAALERLAHSPYAHDDNPHLSMKFSLGGGYEQYHLEDKATVDSQGVQDNLYWYTKGRGF